jgi:hypothetical protein
MGPGEEGEGDSRHDADQYGDEDQPRITSPGNVRQDPEQESLPKDSLRLLSKDDEESLSTLSDSSVDAGGLAAASLWAPTTCKQPP